MSTTLTAHYELKHLDVTPDAFCATIFLPENLLYFDGHFDEMPMLPGVVQVNWAIELAQAHLNIAEDFQAIDSLKFMKIISPDSTVDIIGQYDTARNIFEFSYVAGETKHSTGKVRFG